MYLFLSSLVVCVLAYASGAGQSIRPLPSAKVLGELQRLRTLTSVLYVAAHPDDENTRLLSWLATGRHIRTAYLSLTRGDGGQNIIGSEQGSALGLIRTYELMAARKIDGAEQFFARAIDFGYSKSAQETFKQWDSIVLIADVVRTIRLFRPDVVICRFPKDSMAGHGQHAASAIIAERAVEYCYGEMKMNAVTATKLEMLLKGTTPWKPKRLLFNAYRFGSRSTVRDGMFKLEVGQYDPLIGMGYGELAGISRSIHRSQGAGTPSTPGVQPEYFATLIGTEPGNSLFNGIDTTWSRVGRDDIANEVDNVISTFNMMHPELSLGRMFAIRTLIHNLKDEAWRIQKTHEIESIILSCLGVSAEATTQTAVAVAGDSLRTTLRIATRAGTTLRLVRAQWPDGAIKEAIALPHDSLVTIDVATQIPHSTAVSQPYWLAEESTNNLFSFPANMPPDKCIMPMHEASLVVRVVLAVGADTVKFSLPISHKKLEPLRGDVIEALRIVPAVSIEPVQLVETKDTTIVRIRAFKKIDSARIVIQTAGGVLAGLRNISIKASTDTLLKVPLTQNGGTVTTIGLEVGGTLYNRHIKTINYDHLPVIQYATTSRVATPDKRGVKVAASRIAYIAGAGEYAPEFLRGMGVVVDEIDDATILRTKDLLAYDAVLVGIRAINTRPSMQYLMPALISYVELGGTLVMQYNTLQDMSTKHLGPYPLTLANKRVTEEDVPVTILKPKHRIFTHPNLISAEDFSGWVQERGLYYPVQYDNRYEALLAMSDTNDEALTGSLLYARYGKGHYISCSLSLFRQLPAGVSGAMRLFANIISMR